VGQGLLIIEDSRSHSNTPHSVGLLWTRDQPVAETSTWQHTTVTKDKTSMVLAGFEPTISASERPPTDTLDRATTGTSIKYHWVGQINDKQTDKKQGCTNPGYNFSLVTKFTATALNTRIFESSVWILFHITLLTPVILRWLLEFFLVECIARVVVTGNWHEIEGR